MDDLQECIDDCPKGIKTKKNMKTLSTLLYKYAIPRRLAEMDMGHFVTVRDDGDSLGKGGLPVEDLRKLSHLKYRNTIAAVSSVSKRAISSVRLSPVPILSHLQPCPTMSLSCHFRASFVQPVACSGL